MNYHHLGIPTTTPQPGETYLAKYGLYCTDHARNPLGIQWMRYEPDCPLPDLVKTVAHVAFEVDDLDRALEGQEILIAPNSPSDGVRVAFVVCDGAPVEFLEFRKRSCRKRTQRTQKVRRNTEGKGTRGGRARAGARARDMKAGDQQ